jgi:tetratricopeptide (TPR) repeat protein/class 3 adenylate cyclase
MALLTILRHQANYFFYLSLAEESGFNAAAYYGVVPLDSVWHDQLQKALDATSDTLQIIESIAATQQNANHSQLWEQSGRLLYSLLPGTCQQAIRHLPPHIPLVLATNDPELPWELLHDGTAHLALQRPLGRQLLTAQLPTASSIVPSHRHTFLFISNPTGDLPEADNEALALMDAFDSLADIFEAKFLGRSQATRLNVREALASGRYDLIHYSGHARPGALLLADGELAAAEIQHTLRGKPFIFLNACRSARNKDSASPLPYSNQATQDMATAFILGGASGFIGTLWPVFDDRSRTFAEKFYNHARQGLSVGQALQQTRLHTNPDPLWAAFVLVGDPNLTLIRTTGHEKRTMTALVVTLAGLPALYEKVGLETAVHIENQLKDHLSQIIYRYGGTIMDSPIHHVAAYFGLQTSHEDDTEHAARAAIDIQTSLHSFLEQHLPAYASQLTLQAGLCTGRVMSSHLYTSSGRKLQVAGPIADRANVLAANASPGNILLDEASYRQLHHLFDLVAITPKQDSQPLYRLLGARAEAGGQAMLVGRQAELAQLRGWWQEALAGQARVVSIMGAAGLGKTYLVQAWAEELTEQSHRWLIATCHVYDQDVSYALLAQIIRQLARITADDSVNAIRHKLDKLVAAALSHSTSAQTERQQEGVALLGQVLGLPVTVKSIETLEANLRQRLVATICQAILAQQAQQIPLVLLLDDVHWADEASLAILGEMLETLGWERLLVLVLHRSAWAFPWPGWSHYRHLPLAELTEADQNALFVHLLEAQEIPAATRSAILTGTGGNPFFMAEVVHAFRENPSTYLVAEDAALSVPDKVESVIQARLDRLTTSAQIVLRVAAVLGQTFDHRLLELVVDQATRHTHLEEGLRELLRQQVLLRTGWPETTYQFRHSLIHQVAYEHLLSRFRRTQHRLAAQSLRRLYGDQAADHLEQIAHHYSHSDDRVNSIYYGLQAGQRAAQRWANRTALTWYERVLVYLESFVETPVTESEREQGVTAVQLQQWRVAALTGQGEVLVMVGEYEMAVTSYQQALALVTDNPVFSIQQQADLLHSLAVAYHDYGAFVEAQEWLAEGLRLLSKEKGGEIGRLYVWQGILHYRLGCLHEGLEACEQGISILKETANQHDLAQAYNLQGILYRTLGDPQLALAAHEQSVALYEENQYLPGLERAYTNLGVVCEDLGRWDETLLYFFKSRELSERIGDERRRLASHINLAEIYYLKGSLDESVETVHKVLPLSERLHLPEYQMLALMILGKVALKRDDLGRATGFLEASYTLCQQLRSKIYLPEIARHLAKLYLKQDDLKRALETAEAGLSLVQATGSRELGQCQRTVGEIYLVWERWQESLQQLQQSLALLQEQGNLHEVGLTWRVLAEYHQAQLAQGGSATEHRSEGLAACERAVTIFRQLGAVLDLAEAEALCHALRTRTVTE